MAIPDYYMILGIAHDALPYEIKKAYKEKARLYHPDVFHNENSVEVFQLLNIAYHTLIDPSLRKRYDLELKFPGSFTSKPEARYRHPSDAKYYERRQNANSTPQQKRLYRNLRRLNSFIFYSIVTILGIGIIFGIIDLVINLNFGGLLFSIISLAIIFIGVRIIKHDRKYKNSS